MIGGGGSFREWLGGDTVVFTFYVKLEKDRDFDDIRGNGWIGGGFRR